MCGVENSWIIEEIVEEESPGAVQFIRILTLRLFVFALQSPFAGDESELGDFLFSLIGKACDANASICADSDAVSPGL